MAGYPWLGNGGGPALQAADAARLMEEMTEGVWIVDAESGRVRSASPVLQRLFGEQIGPGTDARRFVPPEFAGQIFPDRAPAEAGRGEPKQTFAYSWQPDGGPARWIETTTWFTTHPTSGRLEAVCVSRDATARRAAADWTQALFENGPAGAALVRRSDGCVLDANNILAGAMGYKRDEIIGRSAEELGMWALNEDRERFYERLDQGASFDSEFSVRRKDGAIVHAMVSARSFALGGERVYLVQAVNISRQKQAEADSQAQAQRFEALFNSSPAAIVLQRATDRVIVEANPAVLEALGYTRAELIGKTPRQLDLWPEAFQAEAFADCLESTGRVTGYACSLRRKDGQVRSMILAAQVLQIDGIDHLLAQAVDIHEQKTAEEALLAREQQLADIFNNSPAAIMIVTHVDHRVIDVNPAASAQMGRSREDILGKTAQELGLWDSPAERAAIFARLEMEGRVEGAEVTLRDSRGQAHQAVISIRPSVVGGEPCLLIQAIDVTESRRAERELELFFNAMPDLAAIASETHFKKVNAAWERVLGYPPAELAGKPIAGMIHPEDLAATGREIEAQHEARASANFSNRYLAKDGTIRWLEWNTVPAREAGLVYAVARDITAQRAAEQARREAEERYRLIAENSTDMIWMADLPGLTFSYLSPSTERLLGYIDSELLGRPVALVCEPQAYARDAARLGEWLAGLDAGEPRPVSHINEVHLLRKDGSVLPVEAAVTILRDAEGTPRQVLGVSRDISRRKAAEAQASEIAQRFNALFYNAPLAGVIYRLVRNPAGQVVDLVATEINRMTEHSRRVDGPEMIGRSQLELFGPEAMQPYLEIARQMDVENGARQYETVFQPTGRAYLISVFMVGPDHVATLALDTTERQAAEKALRESEERLQLAQHVAGVGSWAVALDCSQADWSAETFRILGVPAGQSATTDLFASLVHPEDRERVQRAFEDILAGQPYDLEHRILRPDGEVRWVRGVAERHPHTPGLVVGAVQDITARRAAEEALQKSEANLRRAQKVARVGSWTADLRARAVECTEEAFRIFGLSPEMDFNMAAMKAMVAPEDRDRVQLAWDAMLRGGAFEIEHRLVRPDGEVRWVHVLAESARDETGRPMLATGAVQDITENRAAEAALRESEERFRLIASTIDEVFWMTQDQGDQFLYVSPAFERIWGFPAERLRQDGGAFTASIDPEDRARVQAVYASQDRQDYDIEYRIRRPDGAQRWIWERGYPVPDGEERAAYWVGVLRDITGRKEAESALREREHSLRLRTEDLLIQLEAGRQLRQAKSEQAVYQILEGAIRQAFACDLLVISDFDPHTRVLRARYACTRGEAVDVSQGAPARLPDGCGGAHARALLENQSFLIARFPDSGGQRCPQCYPEMMGMAAREIAPGGSAAGVPILIDGRVAGLLQVFAAGPEALADSHLRFLETLALHAGSALEAVRMVADLEARVQERAAEVADLYERAPAGYHSLDAQGRFTRVNQTELGWLGYQRDELIGQDAGQVLTPESAALFRQCFDRAADEGRLEETELDFVRKDGSVMPAALTGRGVYGPDGRLSSLRFTVIDITQRRQAQLEGRALAERLDLAAESIGIGIWDWDMRNDYAVWDARTSALHEQSAGARPGPAFDAWLAMIHPQDRPAITGLIEDVRRGTDRFSIDYRVPRPGLPDRWLRDEGKVFRDSSGRPVRMIGVNYDITERKESEAALQQLAERLDLAARAAGIGIWDWHIPSGRMVWDERMHRLMDVSEATFLDHCANWTGLMHEADRQKVIDAGLAAAAGGEFAVEFRVQCQDGSLRWLSVSGQALNGRGGQAERMVGVCYDITARKAAEEQMLFQSTMLTLIGQAVIATDMNGTVTYMNRAAEALYGWTAEEALGRTVIEITVPEEGAAHAEEIMTALRNGETLTGEFLARRRDGTPFWIEVTDAPIQNERGELVGIIGVSSDISRRKAAEERTLFQAKLLDIIGQAVIVSDNDGRITYWNGAAQTIYGWTAKEAIGRSVYDTTVAEASQEQAAEIMAALRAGHPWTGEFVVRGRDNRPFWAEITDAPVYDKHGQMIGIIGVSTDISRRKAAEERTMFQARLLEIIQQAVIVSDLHGQITYWNRAAEILYGWKAEEAVGRLIQETIIPPAARPESEFAMEQLRSGSFRAAEYLVCRRDRTLFWAEVTNAAVLNERGEMVAIIGVSTDISARKAEGERLRESEAQNRLLFEESPAALTLLDESGQIVRANRAFARLIKAPDAPAALRFAAGLYDQLLGDARQGGYRSLEHIIACLDGSEVNAESQAFALQLGGARHLLVTTNDITAYRRAEEALRLANDEMERAMRLKDEFLANMSHELRTPLNAIIGISESMADEIPGPLNKKQLTYIRTVEESGRHLLQLINDILDLSKIGAGKMELEFSEVPVFPLVASVLRMVREQAARKHIDLTQSIDPDAGAVRADERRLKQVLVNLLNNAIKFTTDGGEVHLAVAAQAETGTIALHVRDSGIGIQASDIPRLFQPFVQLDAGLSRERAGTGLGLALVSQIVRLHGGSVAVESTPGKGSRFTVLLPWQTSGAPEGALEREAAGTRAPAGAGNGRRILLVEDTDSAVMVVRDYLESIGYRVDVARDGIAGVQAAVELRPDLILMDVQMPGMSGLEATARIREHPNLRGTPILALTALAMKGDRERCLAAGMDDYISKPLNLRELPALIEKHIRNVRGAV